MRNWQRSFWLPALTILTASGAFHDTTCRNWGAAVCWGLLFHSNMAGQAPGIPEMAQVLERMAQACASTAMVTLMHYCGTAVIAAQGSAALKQSLLPAIAGGKHLTTLAFSEAGSGGHFYMPVSEVRRNGHGLALTAHKTFVTSAGEADS